MVTSTLLSRTGSWKFYALHIHRLPTFLKMFVSLSTVSPLLAKNILYYSYWFKWAFMDVTFNFLEENILLEPEIDKLMQKRK